MEKEDIGALFVIVCGIGIILLHVLIGIGLPILAIIFLVKLIMGM